MTYCYDILAAIDVNIEEEKNALNLLVDEQILTEELIYTNQLDQIDQLNIDTLDSQNYHLQDLKTQNKLQDQRLQIFWPVPPKSG